MKKVWVVSLLFLRSVWYEAIRETWKPSGQNRFEINIIKFLKIGIGSPTPTKTSFAPIPKSQEKFPDPRLMEFPDSRLTGTVLKVFSSSWSLVNHNASYIHWSTFYRPTYWIVHTDSNQYEPQSSPLGNSVQPCAH